MYPKALPILLMIVQGTLLVSCSTITVTKEKFGTGRPNYPPLTDEELNNADPPPPASSGYKDFREPAGRLNGRTKSFVPPKTDKWPYGIVPYKIQANFNQEERNQIGQAVATLNAETCVLIVPYNETKHSHMGWVEFVDHVSDSCFVEDLGYFGRRAHPLNVGRDLWFCATKGSMMHELSHILGAVHEHVRPDRDDFITVNWTNIYPDPGTFFQFLRTCGKERDVATPRCQSIDLAEPENNGLCCIHLTDTGRTGYDRSGIMHYDNRAATINNDGSYTMTWNADPSLQFGSKDELTKKDKKDTNYFYKRECRRREKAGGDEITPVEDITLPRISPTIRLNGRLCDGFGRCNCRLIESPNYPFTAPQGISAWKFKKANDCSEVTMHFAGIMDIDGTQDTNGEPECTGDSLSFFFGPSASEVQFAEYCGFHEDHPDVWTLRGDDLIVTVRHEVVAAGGSAGGFRMMLCAEGCGSN